MTGYRITPSGVETTLSAVRGNAEELVASLDEITGPATAADAEVDPVVAHAIAEFYARRRRTVQNLAAQIDHAAEATAQALRAYDEADEQMTATSTRFAAQAE